MKIAAWCQEWSDSFLKKSAQLGINCLDHVPVPQVAEGYPDLDGLLEVRKRLRSWGLDWHRMSLPQFSEDFMKAESDAELDRVCNWMEIYAQAGIPIIRAAFANDRFTGMDTLYEATHRGDYVFVGRSKISPPCNNGPPSSSVLELWWERFRVAYSRLVPIAEDYDVKLVMHPSDPPHPDSLFGGLGFHRIIDSFPSRNVGYLYCCGTRSEAGGWPLVLDEIHKYGREGRLHAIHFRNTRGSFATAGAYEEVLMNDGDVNLFRVIKALKNVGFNGCLNYDHIPKLEGDEKSVDQSLAYSVGYMKALLAAADST